MEEIPVSSKPKLILLDVYETMLDMTDIERRINHLLNSKRGYVLWFELFMQYTFVSNSINDFHSFHAIAEASLSMTSRLLDREIKADQIHEILDLLKHLPVHEGVQEGLSALSDQNYRLAALTNSPASVINNRMERTGLISFFEKVLSAEDLKKYKPDLEVYIWAAGQFDLATTEILMVSAHSWDIAGSAKTGMQTAYIQHKKQMLYPLAAKPTFIAKNLQDLTEQLQSAGH